MNRCDSPNERAFMAHPNSLANLRPAWQPGQSGNMAGRKPAGLNIKEWHNQISNAFDRGELTIEGVREIAKSDPNGNRRVAAIQWVEATTRGDVASYEPFLTGEKSLTELQSAGVDTSALKKVSVKRYESGEGNKKETSEHVTIELRHPAGEASDRIMDRTIGKPVQHVEVAKVDLDVEGALRGMAQLLREFPELMAEAPAEIVADVQAISAE